MHILPAVVPEGEFPRSEVVAVRLARKVAPLFGVRWEHNPFARTWVCDYAALTLAEVARGAPIPSKPGRISVPVGVTGSGGDGPGGDGSAAEPAAGWGWNGRAVWTAPGARAPAVLANATLNRFGPNTKAAVVLTAANRLLQDATAAVEAVCGDLNGSPAGPQMRLAIWAGLVLEVFRGQPALVVAAIQARAVQRSLTARWGAQVGLGDLGKSAARCEIGAAGVGEQTDPWHPIRFSLIDDTLELLDLSAAGPIGPDRQADIAAAWCRRLLNMGRPGSGMVWLVEDDDGHRFAHSFQRVGAMVAPFVAEVLDASTRPTDDSAPRLVDPIVAPGSDATVRARAVATHIAVNYLRYIEESATDFARLRERTREAIGHAAKATLDRLGPADPASLLLTGYGEYLQLWDLTQAGGADAETLRSAAENLLAGARRTMLAWQGGTLDPGAASYLLEIGNVALAAVRDQVEIPGVDRALARMWREALSARGVDPDPAAVLDQLNQSQIFHLATYGDFLASRATTSDLRRALRILEAVTDIRERVAAGEAAVLPAKFASPRDAHQAAAKVAAGLARSLPARERSARVAAWASAVRHALAVLADPSTEELLARGGSDNAAVRMAAVKIEPALSHLLDDGLAVDALNADARIADVRVADAPAVDGELWTPTLRSVALRLMERAQCRPGNPGGEDKPNAAVARLWARLQAESDLIRSE
ncbi:MAG TPA: hypothetical protein VLL08_10940 [Kineosporiaceae bacterium]|nr:hypothetical protein [Kineosporiaceae bacterium]